MLVEDEEEGGGAAAEVVLLPSLVAEAEAVSSEVMLLSSGVAVLVLVGVDEYHTWPVPPATAQPSRL
jgi:hypothetical protein